MTQPSQPPNSLQPYIDLAQSLREAAASRDYTELGRLVAHNLQLEMVDIMVYVRTPIGHLTIVGSYIQHWSPLAPDELNREPNLTDMAIVLQAAARR